MACKGKQKSMAHNEGCGDHRRKYRKRKIGNGRQRKATNWCGKKGLLRKTASHRLPLTEGNGKKGKLTCHGRQRTMVAKKTTENLRTENRKKKLRKNFYGKQSQQPPLGPTNLCCNLADPSGFKCLVLSSTQAPIAKTTSRRRRSVVDFILSAACFMLTCAF